MRVVFFFIFSITCLIISCTNDINKPQSNEEILSYKEPLVKVNQILVDKDSDLIASYCNRRNLNLNSSESGLWYKIYHTGKGDSAKSGIVANLNYKITLLDGKQCYSSDSLGPKSFLIGQGGVEKGLEIGILMMREGDKAKFILPPGLAWGLIGDEKKIPSRSIIIYDVELIELTDY
ncbi:MAG: FKBP-type peptidyl-prolyl cis-trans isomerase [Bacteroidia bacterium]|nr:FKBP-type peptidyl-prolyl cis-trans isomerase [Bacteroidia bacterium]